jgi:hypothetical protein
LIGDRDGEKLDEIGGAGDAPGVERDGFVAAAACDSAGDRQTRAEPIRKETTEGLRPDFGLPIHVWEKLDGRAPGQVAATAGDADDDENEE